MVSLTDIFDKIKDTFNKVKDILSHVSNIAGATNWTHEDLPTAISKLRWGFSDPGNRFSWLFRDVINPLEDHVSGQVDWLWDKFSDITNVIDVTDWTSPELGTMFWKLRKAMAKPEDFQAWVFRPLRKSITSVIAGQLKWRFGQISSKLSGVSSSLSADISGLGEDVDGWLDEQWENIDEGLGDVQDSINSSLSDTGSWLQSQMDKAHKATRTAFSQALGSMQSAVGGAIGALWDNLKSAVKVIDPSKWVSDLQSQLQSHRKRLEEILAPGSPLSPEEAKSKADDFFVWGNALMGLLAAGKIGAEVASLGQVDITLDSINNIPLVEAYSSIIDRITSVRIDAGLTQAYRYWVQSRHTPKIPGKSDLTHYLVREALAGGSASERMDNYKKWMNYLGYSDKWAEIEWDAHWELPSWFRVRDALRRGVIDEKEFKKFMRYLDYRPDARDWQTQSDQELMVKLAYRTWGIRDIRRAWELGVINDKEMKERLQNRGYDPDEIEKITKVQQNIAFRAEINDRVREDRDAVRDGYMSTEQFRANMEALGMAPWKRDYKVAYAKKRRRAEYYETMIDTIKDAYTEGAFGEGRLISLLKRFIVSEKALAMHVTEAYVKKMGEWPEPEDIGGIKPIQVS